MELIKAETLARNLINQHLGDKWHFKFDRAVRRFGCCCHTDKLITLSKKLVELNDESQVTDTILHEIAHGLVGMGHGHDKIWKQKCIEIGAKPERCYSTKEVKTPTRYYKYKLVCDHCGRETYRLRKPRCNYSCGYCTTSKRFNPNLILRLEAL